MWIIGISLLAGCGKAVSQEQGVETVPTQTTEVATESEEEQEVDWSKFFEDKNWEVKERYKGKEDGNPVMTQTFGADPYAMVYEDRVYIYMTADAYEYDSQGNIVDNSYSKIQSIRVISTNDMVNFTDHGAIQVAGVNGCAKWAHNSWAPAAAWKEINGKPQFFLYFADAGGGIGVLQSDSPTGPFIDPLGKGLVTRETPNCSNVTWLFDPAVLVDDDGRAYLYFGGGIPEGMVQNPQTARVVELGEDMISIIGEPQMIDAPYLFEDSGIHKAGEKYYYTYCSNWQVDEAGTDKYGFTNAEIISMESDSPMGPFKVKEKILENPGKTFGLYGNNHHCVFSFQNQWYITYHTRQLEKKLGVEKGYRSTHIDSFTMGEDGTIGVIKQTLTGCEQLRYVNPYIENNAANLAVAGDIEMVAADTVCGEMALGGIDSGDFVQIRGVDFEQKTPASWKAYIRQSGNIDESCVIQLRLDSLRGEVIGYLPVGYLISMQEHADKEFIDYETQLLKKVTGVHDLYLIFSGSGYEVKSWVFEGTDEWYREVMEKSLLSTGTNGRLERVLSKLENGEKVSIAFIGGSVTEGAGAAKITDSYADRVITYLKDTYKEAEITYVNAGLGGTPSALGVMRYERDVLQELEKTPDLVFVEFAVNDYQEPTNGRAYESLVRRILEENEETAVALIFAVFQSKWNMQDTYIPIGEYYGLPMVSIKDAVNLAYEKEKLTDKEYFSDEYHPTSYGHKIMADCIDYMLEEAAKKEKATKIAVLPEGAKLGLDFQSITLLTANDTKGVRVEKGDFCNTDTQVHMFGRKGQIAFPDNWMYEGTGTNTEFSVKLTCKNILLNYKLSSSEDFGTVVVMVDGQKVTELSGYSQGGWNQSNVVLLLDEKESDTHVISIKMKDGDERKKFTILGIGYTE